MGYSKNFSERKRQHFKALRNKYHYSTHLQNAFDYYGEQNFIFEILEECEPEFLCSQEHYWCNLLNAHDDRFGYNIRPTHPHNLRAKNSKETREKISKILKGRVAWNKGLKYSKEQKVNFYRSQEFKIKLSEKMKKQCNGIFPNITEKDRKRSAITNKIQRQKSVLQFDLDGNFIKEWDCMNDAVKECNTYLSGIINCCKNKYGRKSAAGFKWKYKDE